MTVDAVLSGPDDATASVHDNQCEDTTEKHSPVGWKRLPLNELCRLQRGFDITESSATPGKVPVYSSSGLSYFHDRHQVLPPGVLTGRKGILGRVFYVTCPFWPHDTTLWVTDFRGNDPAFVYWLLLSLRLERFDAASAVPTLNRNSIAGLPVLIPPPAEQRAIAEALSDVDELSGALDKLIAKKRAIKLATMQRLLTGKTRLPGFSGEWEETTLGELATFLSGGTPSRSIEEYWNGAIPWISATSLRCFEICRSDSNVTEEAVTAGSKMAPVGSTLLLVRGSALHKEILCGLVTKPVCFNQDVKALVPHSQVVPVFLTTVLKGRADDLLRLVSSAGNTAGVLDTKLLKAFEINLPDRDEQVAIAGVLSDMDAEIAVLEQRRDKTRAIKQGMMQSLLTGRVRLVQPEGAP